MKEGMFMGRKLPACKFNVGVDCTDKIPTCDKCGWDPDVASKRKELNRQYPERVQAKV